MVGPFIKRSQNTPVLSVYIHAGTNYEISVFLISLKAGGADLNLTGADVVIHYDPWWNIAAQNQATDRAHCIGQTKKATVYKPIVRHSIEKKLKLRRQNATWQSKL